MKPNDPSSVSEKLCVIPLHRSFLSPMISENGGHLILEITL
jgi:hypothetical protein